MIQDYQIYKMIFIIKLKSLLRNPIRSILLFFYHIKNISFFPPTKKKQIIICFDGFSQHGGLVDRLKGIISFYETAKQTGFEFKIYHEFPQRLEAFLEPNQYNWIATKKDMKWNPIRTKFLYSMLDFELNPIDFFSKTTKDKVFVYNNIDYASYNEITNSINYSVPFSEDGEEYIDEIELEILYYDDLIL